jgi:hypothetical protein
MDTIDQNQSSERFRFPGKRKMDQTFPASNFSNKFAKGLDRGFNLEYVKDANGNAMSYTVNHTMMNQFGY